jgi:hypothetical protein
MGRVAFVVFLLSLEVVGQAYSVSSADAAGEGRASLVTGLVPLNQLGSGVANTSTCQNGNSTWGSCGGGSPAGITYATTVQNWRRTSTSALTAGSPGTVTLTPCPSGVDYTSGAGYQVYISDTNAEAVSVTSGSTGPGNCSITFTPYFGHTSYTIGSASSGVQETINIACGVYSSTNPTYNAQCNVTIPANGPYLGSGSFWSLNNYNIYGTIFFHSNQSALNGRGVSLNCLGRGACLQVGDRVKSIDYQNTTVTGISFRSPTNVSALAAFAGSAITTTSSVGTVATITTASAHGFRPGDIVDIQFTDKSRYWGDALVATVPTSTTFTFTKSSFTTDASTTSPGVVALAYEAILDNAQNTHFVDINYDVNGELGAFNNFFDFWDDENATIDHFNNNGGVLNGNANWLGSWVYSGGGPWNSSQQFAPVITLRDSSITAVHAAGITVDNSNGVYIENTVLQAASPWQFRISNLKGNYQGAYLKNIYSESNIGLNPACSPGPCYSPFGGLGIAGLIAGASTNVANYEISGATASLSGAFLTGGTGTTALSYFIVANDWTGASCGSGTHTQTAPMQILNWLSTGSDSIPVRWPRIGNGSDAICYDVLRMSTPVGVGGIYPYTGGCPGGTGGSCGYVAVGITQATACGNTLACTYTDNGASSTTAYTVLQGNYAGNLNFWPGVIVSVTRSIVTTTEQPNSIGVGLTGNPVQISNVCNSFGTASPGGYTACTWSISTANNSVKNQTAAILSDGGNTGGGMALSKGRLNFSTAVQAVVEPHHIITLIDSQPGLTQATVGYRPPASANDVWIGTDVPARGVGLNAGQLAFGAPVSITNYIAATGGSVHTNWLERLTSTQKTFAIPVRISDGNSFTLGDGSPLSQMKIYSVKNMPASHVPPQSCVDVVGEAKGLTKSDQITSITPPGRLGNLSLNAYPADESAIILHFCNPSGSEAIAPSGAYSFLAVR